MDELWQVLGVREPKNCAQLVESNFRFEDGHLTAHSNILTWSKLKQQMNGLVLLATKMRVATASRWLQIGSSSASVLRAEYLGASCVHEFCKAVKDTDQSQPLYYVRGWKEFEDDDVRNMCLLWLVASRHAHGPQQT